VLEDALNVLKPEIEHFITLSNRQTTELDNALKNFETWLPKLDLITKIDVALKNEAQQKQKSKEKSEELILKIKALEHEGDKVTKDLTDAETRIKINETFINQNKFLKDVDLKISN
jgi:exonuclease SbcC